MLNAAHHSRVLGVGGGPFGDVEVLALIVDRLLWARVEEAVVVILVSDGVLHQSADMFWVLGVELVDSIESVGEARLAASTGVVDAVEELEAWRVAHVKEIHVEAEIFRRVRNIFGVGYRSDVPGRTVEGVLKGTDAVYYLGNGEL